MNTKMGILFHSAIPEIMRCFLIHGGPMNATQIGRIINVDNSGVLRTLKLLQRRGYVSKVEKSHDWMLTRTGLSAALLIVNCMEGMEAL